MTMRTYRCTWDSFHCLCNQRMKWWNERQLEVLKMSASGRKESRRQWHQEESIIERGGGWVWVSAQMWTISRIGEPRNGTWRNTNSCHAIKSNQTNLNLLRFYFACITAAIAFLLLLCWRRDPSPFARSWSPSIPTCRWVRFRSWHPMQALFHKLCSHTVRSIYQNSRLIPLLYSIVTSGIPALGTSKSKCQFVCSNGRKREREKKN